MIHPPETSPMFSIPLILTTLLLSGNALSAELQIITDQGREVLLKENGRWEYRSTDHFATTNDGRQVRMKEDGSWSYTDKPPSKTRDHVGSQDLDIQLKKVVVEKYRIKTQKNARTKSQTVFYVHINNSLQDKTDIDIEHKDISLIEVKDNNGKNYPVLSIKADISNLQYGKGITVKVRTEKSPSVLEDVNSMTIKLKAGIFGIKNTVSFSQNVSDFEEINVDGFE